MRISDWSSDVCSSDLKVAIPRMFGSDAQAGWRAVVDAVHAGGAAILPQLWHQGPLRDATASTAPHHPGLRPSGLWGTPGLPSYSDEYVRRLQSPYSPLSYADIAAVIAGFARASPCPIAPGPNH